MSAKVKDIQMLSARNVNKKDFNLYISNTLGGESDAKAKIASITRIKETVQMLESKNVSKNRMLDFTNPRKKLYKEKPQANYAKPNTKKSDFLSYAAATQDLILDSSPPRKLSNAVQNLSGDDLHNHENGDIGLGENTKKKLITKIARLTSIYHAPPKKNPEKLSTLFQTVLNPNQYAFLKIGMTGLPNPKVQTEVVQKETKGLSIKNSQSTSLIVNNSAKHSFKGIVPPVLRLTNHSNKTAQLCATTRKMSGNRSTLMKIEEEKHDVKINPKSIIAESYSRSTASNSLVKQDSGRFSGHLKRKNTKNEQLSGISVRVKNMLEEYKRREIILLEANKNLRKEVESLQKALLEYTNKK